METDQDAAPPMERIRGRWCAAAEDLSSAGREGNTPAAAAESSEWHSCEHGS